MQDEWASPAFASDGTSTAEVIAKESQITDITALQRSLGHLLAQVNTLEAGNEKLKAEGDVLQTYIENLTKTAISSVGGRR